jgi:hypothetical protein
VLASDSRFRRLGDFVAGTLVVAEHERTVESPISQLSPSTPKELARMPSHAVPSPQEVDAIELFLRRRPLLSEARADELAELAAESMARRFGVRYESASRFLELLYYRALGGPPGIA